MTHYIYIASKNSYNEGQGYKSLEFITTTESWEDAYQVMVKEGEKLQAQGWSEGSKSRSKDYSNDVWLEPDYGQKWQDWHEKEVICSTSPLKLTTNPNRTSDGYPLRKSHDSAYSHEVHKFSIDACTIQGDPEQGMWDRECVAQCKSLREAQKYVREHKDKEDMFEIWDEWYTCDLDNRGEAVEGDLISQTVYSYVNGKLVHKDKLL